MTRSTNGYLWRRKMISQKQELVGEVTSYLEYGLLPALKEMPSLWSIRDG